MDEDEEQRSTAVAVCDGATGDGATGDGAEESGDAAPPTAEDDAIDETALDETAGEGADVEDDGAAAVAAGNGEATDEPEVLEAAVAVAVVDLVGAELVGSGPRRLGPYLRRGAVALVAAGVVALAVSAFAWVVPSLEAANERFVDAAHSQGHVIAPGEQESLVLSAARKICDRKVSHDTIRERRSTALTSEELAAVGAAFGTESRDFTVLALDTYCPR